MGKAIFKSKEFGAAIKSYRKDRKITLQSASDKLGISRSVFHRIEQGYMPKLEDFYTINKWMGKFPLPKFFTDEDTEQLKNM